MANENASLKYKSYYKINKQIKSKLSKIFYKI